MIRLRSVAVPVVLGVLIVVVGELSSGQGDGSRVDAAPPEQDSPPPAEDAVTILIGEDFKDLAQILEVAAAVKGRPILWEEGQVEGQIRIQPGTQLTVEGMWQLAVNSLALKGLAIVQTPETDALQVVAAENAASIARLEEPDLAGAEAGFLKVLVPLHSLSADRARAAVTLVLSGKGSKVDVLTESNALLIADFAPQLGQALDLLERIDVSQAPPQLFEVKLERADPTTLAALLTQIKAKETVVAGETLAGEFLPMTAENSLLVIAPYEEMSAWKALIERFDRQQALVTEHYQPRRFGLAETAQLVEEVVHGADSVLEGDSWKLVTDELTGTLILTTTPARQREVAQLMARLESTGSEARRPMRTYPIRHRQVSEVLGLLTGVLEEGVLESTEEPVDPEKPVMGATAPLTAQRGLLGDGTTGVTLSADEGTNRLIAIGEARLLDQLGPLIESLDVQEAQVLVEALVVNLSETQMRDLGVELRAAGVSNGVLYELSSLFGLGATAPSATQLPASTASGFSGAVLNPGNFSAVLNAIEDVTGGRTLTMPRVLVNNNQDATLDSVEESPYRSTNASSTVATTSYGGSSEAGTKISVKPQVAAGDSIVIDYSISLSVFVGDSADPDLPPPKQGTTLSSVVTVPDGFTVVVGGIEREVESDAISRVPILGDIPALGYLFSSRSKTTIKAKFFVFLRCNVLRDATFEDLKYMSREPLEKAGLDDGWPRLEPRVMR